MAVRQLLLGWLNSSAAASLFDWLLPLWFAAGLIAAAPLCTGFQFGPDEGFELMKAWLVSLGHPLYAQIWNDQPPLHTEILAFLFRVFGPSAYTGRLLTVGFSTLLLLALYSIVRQGSGRAAGLLSVFLILSSSSFLQLGSSVMLEIPAMSLALTSFWAWRESNRDDVEQEPSTRIRQHARSIIAGVVFGLALQVKLTAAMYLPALVAELLMSRTGGQPSVGDTTRPWSVLLDLSIASASACVTFAVIVIAFYSGDALKMFFDSHFSSGTQTASAGGTFQFHPRILIDDLALLAPASLGIIVSVLKRRRECVAPIILFATTFIIHLFHRPYWSYYVVHLTIPLAWLGGIGITEGFQFLRRQPWPKSLYPKLRLGAGVLMWSATISIVLTTLPEKLHFEFTSLRSVEPVSDNPVVAALAQHAARIHWAVTDQRLAAFWAGVPIPPELALIPTKRIWSGQITPELAKSVLERYRPEIILIPHSFASELAMTEYLTRFYEPDAGGGIENLYVRKQSGDFKGSPQSKTVAPSTPKTRMDNAAH